MIVFKNLKYQSTQPNLWSRLNLNFKSSLHNSSGWLYGFYEISAHCCTQTLLELLNNASWYHGCLELCRIESLLLEWMRRAQTVLRIWNCVNFFVASDMYDSVVITVCLSVSLWYSRITIVSNTVWPGVVSQPVSCVILRYSLDTQPLDTNTQGSCSTIWLLYRMQQQCYRNTVNEVILTYTGVFDEVCLNLLCSWHVLLVFK